MPCDLAGIHTTPEANIIFFSHLACGRVDLKRALKNQLRPSTWRCWCLDAGLGPVWGKVSARCEGSGGRRMILDGAQPHDGPFLATRLRFDPMRFSSAERRGAGASFGQQFVLVPDPVRWVPHQTTVI